MPDKPSHPRRFRLGLRAVLVLVACCAVLLWAGRRVLDILSPVRSVARRVDFGMDLDRQNAIETLIRASGKEIDIALPALLKLEATAPPADRGPLLVAMANLLVERLSPSISAPTRPDPETATEEARLVVDAVREGLKSSDEATRGSRGRPPFHAHARDAPHRSCPGEGT